MPIWSESLTTAQVFLLKIIDVMATIPGHITDEVVICGNHRDGRPIS